jgi:hypothetical protein
MEAVAIVHPRLARASFETAIGPLLTDPKTYAEAGIELVRYEYPHLDVKLHWHKEHLDLLLRVDGTDYNYRPVGGWWINADGIPLRKGCGNMPENMGFHTAMEDATQRGWFCFAGWREYHNHSSHQNVSWASIRHDWQYSVIQLILRLRRNLNESGTTRV